MSRGGGDILDNTGCQLEGIDLTVCDIYTYNMIELDSNYFRMGTV